ncbi:Zinc finger CCCH domain-containing protein 62 [Heracleum sosnowskyi]|uniref:Zinc finger CCCH domain-containing protein 62 n=1 Tax=Heracleum sosnowskyi TaxID=360622 RepID=A0AAD8ICI4_9APIA|nr:Zinc finger CCCH domain-containing protein 62 [Heracleum sosnowskyi]
MCETRGKKRAFISISSDEDEDEDEHDDDDDCYVDNNDSTSCDDDDDDESDSDFEKDVSDSDGEDDNVDDVDKEEAICNKVIRLLGEGSHLEELNLIECKNYLRKLKLRLSGTKAECINRIKEHWRLKDGNGEALYPRSSFNINCTGDVCKGDTVLFTQKVYQKFDKMKRSGNILGKRTVAGRITKESYGAAKQQHTFTVEVFWSKGIKKLAPLFPLLVKGRNLYKMRTYRQRWKSESERLVVLDEKHKRGAAAREVRARKKMKRSFTTAGKKEPRPGGGGNHQRPFNHQLPQNRSIEADKARAVRQHQYTQVKNVRANDHHKNSLTVRRRESIQLSQSRNCESGRRHHDKTHNNEVRIPTYQSYTTSSQDYYHARSELERQRAHLSYPLEWTHAMRLSHSRPYVDDHTLRLPHSRPYVDDQTFSAAEHQRNNNVTYPHYAYTNHIYDPGARSFSKLPVSMETFRPFHLPYRTDAYGPRSRGI